MNDKKEQAIPQDVAEKASAIIDQAFDLFKSHLEKLSKVDEDFDSKKLRTEKRIARGARRTNGRII